MKLRHFLSQSLKSSGAVVLALIMFFAPVTVSSRIRTDPAPFCACCADPGGWSLDTRKIEDYEIAELNRLASNGLADFYTTAGWPDDVSGVSPPYDDLHEALVISIVREQRNWKLFFKTKSDRKGALILALPGTATFFDADISQGPRPEHKHPGGLYKEIRMEGQVRGTGIFAKGIAPKTRFRLVLQGCGNGCLTADDFYRWNLRISGPQARYTIYGFFAKPAS